jgi:hypothetical protein
VTVEPNQNPPSEREWTKEEMEEFFSNGHSYAILTNGGSTPMEVPTIEELSALYDRFKEMFPPLPAYYRINTRTFEAVKKWLPKGEPGPLLFFPPLGSVELRIDESVPDGEAWPPEKTK